MKLYQVDAFASRPFEGNPAAVCLLDKPGDPAWMQALAAEMNLSETAFVTATPDGYALRWFTPSTEVDLCGHATLASAHVLWESGEVVESEAIEFLTQASGTLRAQRTDGWIELDFPSTPEQEASCNVDLERAFGAAPTYVGKSTFDFIVEVPSERIVRAARPDMSILHGAKARGIILTARASADEYDFVSRFFAPSCGVNEDPVTGSSHCCLAPYWARRFGKDELVGYQASARGGIVRVRVCDDRVMLGGQAVTVLEGRLRRAVIE